MAKAYAGIVGAVLLLVGIVGFMTKGMMGMTFYPAHNIIHIASGALGLAAALAAGGAYARKFAQVFGVVYTLVAVLGFVGIADLGPIQLGLNMPYSIVHIAVGLVGLAAGFGGAAAAPKAKAAGAA